MVYLGYTTLAEQLSVDLGDIVIGLKNLYNRNIMMKKLIFNTANGSATSLGRIISLYQLIPLPVTGGGTDSTVTTSVSAGGTATIDLSSIDFGIDFGFLGFGLPTPSEKSNTSGSTTSFGYSTSSSLETITIQNFGSTTLSIKSYAAPRYSNLAFF